MSSAEVIALLEKRIEHWLSEERRNHRSHYAEIARQKRAEVEYLLTKIRDMEVKS